MIVEACLGFILICCLIWTYIVDNGGTSQIYRSHTDNICDNISDNIIDNISDIVVDAIHVVDTDGDAHIDICQVKIIFASQTGTAAGFAIKLQDNLNMAFGDFVSVSVYGVEMVNLVCISFLTCRLNCSIHRPMASFAFYCLHLETESRQTMRGNSTMSLKPA